MVKNTKTWISSERKITLLQNKKSSWLMPHLTHFEKLVLPFLETKACKLI